MAYMAIETSVRTHRKFLAAGPAASWLWLCGLGYCQDGLTDGYIPEAALSFLGVADARPLVERLIEVRLWEQVTGGWRMHDYLQHNKPAEVVREIMRKRRAGGILGGRPPKLDGLDPPGNLEGYPHGAKEGNHPVNPVLDGTVRDSTTSTTGTPPAPLLTFPTIGRDGDAWPLTSEHALDLASCFPGVDILAEARKALAWVRADPKRRKTASGMPRFLASWVTRGVDSGNVARVRQASSAAPESDWYADCQRLHGGRCGGQFKHYIKTSGDAQRAKGAAS